ncbi:hypothetical protein [Polynucleobacter sp. AM-25C3]|uniref:hypothetical protein n=1 Tax=Polynucleobacter sp. AM-25C3 TaxID=1855569 RepID=UPI001C0ADAAB|nr:hypothetical protein [Polynucleobacter sp. AM-25C3]MBU3602325.1 hypothetical protein [Polynucleobacter sp. AM-25C3]
MDNFFVLWLWLSAVSGFGVLYTVLVYTQLIAEIRFADALYMLADSPVKTGALFATLSTIISLVSLLLSNIPYWVSEKPFGWHNLATRYVIVHDQFGTLLVGGSIGGAAIASLLLATLLKRQFVI